MSLGLSLSLSLSLSLKLRLMFKGLLFYACGALFHADWCIRLTALVLFYCSINLANHIITVLMMTSPVF